MVLFARWVLLHGLGGYLLWKKLKWAGGEGRGVQNVYKGMGLDGSWGCWGVGWLEWKLVQCFWAPPFPHLHNVPTHCRQSGRYARKWTSNNNWLLVWKYCQDLHQVPVSSGEVWMSE